MENKILGGIGEDIATSYLLECGFTVLEKNYRYARWEIDIVAKENNVIHFIEVKTRFFRSFRLS